MAREVTTIQMWSSAAAEATKSIDVPSDGLLLRCHMNLVGTSMDAASDGVKAQISFGTTQKFLINDARGVIMTMEFAQNGIGVENVGQSEVLSFEPGGIKVFGGERIFMHTAIIGAGNISTCRCLLIFQFKTSSSRR